MVCICTCARADVPQSFVSQETVGRTALKFGVWLEIHLYHISGTAGRITLKLGVVREPLAMRFTLDGEWDIRTSARVTVHN